MEKTLALQIMQAIQAAESQVNILESLSEKITDDPERKAFRRHLAEVMIGYVDIQMSIVRQYPDLDPDRKPAGEGADRSIKR
jgi:soluble cytochrome b562